MNNDDIAHYVRYIFIYAAVDPERALTLSFVLSASSTHAITYVSSSSPSLTHSLSHFSHLLSYKYEKKKRKED